jgi:hypothetical protein
MKEYLVVVLLLILIGFAACQPQNETAMNATYGGPLAWVDAPLPDSTIPLGPYSIVFHGADEEGVDEFEVHVNGIKEAIVPVQPSLFNNNPGTLYFAQYDWSPPAPGTYLIEIYARNQRATSNPAPVKIVVIGDLLLPLETGTPTPPYQEPPPPDAPAPEAKECIFTALMGLNCRKGPGIFYDYVDSFVKDQSAKVVGASTGGYHWYVFGPNNGLVCAVSNGPQFGYTEGDCEGQSLFTPEPTPTFTPIPTPTYTPTPRPTGCTVRQAGGDIICVSPCPAGATPGETCTP